MAVARQLATVASFPEKALADAGRSSVRHAEQILRRADTVDRVPGFGSSLDAGRMSGEHVDILARTLRQVDPAVRDQLCADAARLVLVAENSTPEEFARSMRGEARRLETDADGDARLERQRRAIRLNTWIDGDSGMGRWSAIWDPDTMLRLENRLDAQVQALFHDAQPDGCPTDLLEKQSYLRATALLALLDGRRGTPGSTRDRRRCRPHHRQRHTSDRLGATRRVTATSPRRTVPDRSRAHRGGPQRSDHRRPRPTEPRSHNPVGQPCPTPRPRRGVCDVCDPRLSSALLAVPSCTTSSGGATTVAQTSTTSYPSANNTTTTSTTTAGC